MYAAYAFLGSSLLIDAVADNPVVEDTCKLLGITGWTAYFVERGRAVARGP